jgi:hypothetical protein
VGNRKDRKEAEAEMSSDQNEEKEVERRSGAERRRFSYSAYIPERRTGRKRRKKTEAHEPLESPKAQDIDE